MRWPIVRVGGFTLLELLIVVVLLAVLLGIALPAYNSSAVKGRRADAMEALVNIALRQEQYRLVRGRFTLDLSELGFDGKAPGSREGYYRLGLEYCDDASPSLCYVARARPAPGSIQLGDSQCTSFSLDARGERSATGNEPDVCW